LKSVEDIHV